MTVRLPLPLLALALVLPLRAAPEDVSLLAAGASVEKVATGFQHGEGPLWHPDGFLLFGDTPSDRLLRVDENGTLSVFRSPCGRTTALQFDPEGRLVAAESHGGPEGARRLSRLQPDGSWITVADRFEGKRFNSPNDIAIDARGHIYFTDPRYSRRETMELTQEAVYRVDRDGRITRLITSLTRPNGILLTADGKTLLVADNPVVSEGHAALWAFDLDAAGQPGSGRLVFDFHDRRGIDGMTLDTDGRIWAAAGRDGQPGVSVFELDAARRTARRVAFVSLPEMPTNCTFGGKARDALYVTTDTTVYRIRTTVHGRPTPPGK